MEIEIRKKYYEDKTTILNILYHKVGHFRFWHREDGPAYTSYYMSGFVEIELYWFNNKRSREDGPAMIWYNEDGVIKAQEFWLNGHRLTEREWLRDTKFKRRLKGTLLEGKY